MTIFKDSHHFSRTLGDVWWQSLRTAIMMTIFKDSHHFSRILGDVWWQSLMTVFNDSAFFERTLRGRFREKQLPGLTKKNRPQRSAFQAWRYQLIANVYQRISWRRMSRGGPEKRCFCVSPKSLSIETRVLRKDGNAQFLSLRDGVSPCEAILLQKINLVQWFSIFENTSF